MHRAAFFDLDGTLIKDKSMINFVRFLARSYPGSICGLSEFIESIQDDMIKGVARVNINREYFRIFAGLHISKMQSLVASWSEHFHRCPSVFNEQVVTTLNRHKEQGEKIVIVTGSFAMLAKEAVRTLPVDDFLCTQPEIVAGRLTGEVLAPCIGEGKRAYMLEYAFENHIDLSRSWAYGDDPSDQHMIETVANGVFV